MFEKDLDRAKSEADIALSLNPNFSGAYAVLAVFTPIRDGRRDVLPLRGAQGCRPWKDGGCENSVGGHSAFTRQVARNMRPVHSLNAPGRRHKVARNLIRSGVAKYQAGEYEPDLVSDAQFLRGSCEHTIAERRDHIDIAISDGMDGYAGIVHRSERATPPQMRAVVEGRTFPSPWGNEHAECPRSVFRLVPTL